MAQPNIDTTGEDGRMTDSSRQRADQENADQRARQKWNEAQERSGARAATPPAAMPPEGQSEEVWQQWWQIQAKFVDDPHSAVAEAHNLVAELVQRVVRRYEDERKQLEGRWAGGGETSTEDLRCALQGYREFFGRLAQL